MTATAAQQLRRILHVIPRVADGEEHPIAELASLAGVTIEMLIEDLSSLAQRFEVPGGFVEGIQIYIDDRTVSVMTSHFLRPMRLTMPELCALELGLAVSRAERPASEHSSIDRALQRVRGVITELPSNDVHQELRHIDASPAGDVAHLSTIRSALRARRKVGLTYRRADESEVRARVISPYALLLSAGMWYIVAHCDDREAVRIFRLDRVVATAQTDDVFGIPDSFRLEAHVRDGRPLQGSPAEVMRVRYSPRIARWIAEREGKTPDADGSLTLEHPLHDLNWGMRHVLQYGPEAEVLAPDSLRVRLAAELEGMIV